MPRRYTGICNPPALSTQCQQGGKNVHAVHLGKPQYLNDNGQHCGLHRSHAHWLFLASQADKVHKRLYALRCLLHGDGRTQSCAPTPQEPATGGKADFLGTDDVA